ncbi:MAG: HIT family protein [Firmicutes bacterium]|nr:HIT family protein [Bacillota bacterium]
MEPRTDPCPFCALLGSAGMVAEHKTVFAVFDIAPFTPGHLLVITKRHTNNYLTMTPEERTDAGELLKELSEKTVGSDPTVLGFNVGSNCGEAAGQSVMHAHIHLVPRRRGDRPRWGRARGSRSESRPVVS